MGVYPSERGESILIQVDDGGRWCLNAEEITEGGLLDQRIGRAATVVIGQDHQNQILLWHQRELGREAICCPTVTHHIDALDRCPLPAKPPGSMRLGLGLEGP